MSAGLVQRIKMGAGPGSEDFEVVSPLNVIGANWAAGIAKLQLNGEWYGPGIGGVTTDDFVFQQSEYITDITAYYDIYVAGLEFTTSTGRTWQAGNRTGTSASKSNIRVLGIGSSFDSNGLKLLTIWCLDPYVPPSPSTTFNKDKYGNIWGIFDIYPPGSSIEEYENYTTRALEAVRTVSEISIGIETAATASYMIAQMSARFNFGYLQRQEIDQEIERLSQNAVKNTLAVPSGMWGFALARLEAMSSSESGNYVVPTTAKSVSVIEPPRATPTPPLTPLEAVSFVDFTGRITFDFPSLAARGQEQFGGLDFYPKEQTT